MSGKIILKDTMADYIYVLILRYQYQGYLRMITEWVTFNKKKPEIYFPSLLESEFIYIICIV